MSEKRADGGALTGGGDFVFVDEKGNPDKPIRVWFYAPDELPPEPRVLFVMHGSTRSGEPVRDDWKGYAAAYHFLLVVPEFSDADYGGAALYALGNMFDAQNEPVLEAKWTYSAIEHLFDHVKSMAGLTTPRYCIYGNSAGGQFVHRLLLHKSGARIERAVASNAAFYAMPTAEVDHPFGLKGSGCGEEHLRLAFEKDFALLLGEKDNDENDPNFVDKSPEAMRQGRHRLERGQTFYRVAKAESERLGGPFNWRLATVLKAGHYYPDLLPAVAQALFDRYVEPGAA